MSGGDITYIDWCMYLFLSMMAILLLPRQFQIIVVENVNEEHLKKAIWLFPMYLVAINIFVLPVAFSRRAAVQRRQYRCRYFCLDSADGRTPAIADIIRLSRRHVRRYRYGDRRSHCLEHDDLQ